MSVQEKVKWDDHTIHSYMLELYDPTTKTIKWEKVYVKAAYDRAIEALKDAKAGLEKFREGCDPAWGPEYLERLEAALTDLGELNAPPPEV